MGEFIQREGRAEGRVCPRGGRWPLCRLLCALNSISGPLPPDRLPSYHAPSWWATGTLLLLTRPVHQCCLLSPGKDSDPEGPGPAGWPHPSPGQACCLRRASSGQVLSVLLEPLLLLRLTIQGQVAGPPPPGAQLERPAGSGGPARCVLLCVVQCSPVWVGPWSRRPQDPTVLSPEQRKVESDIC